LEKHIPKSGDVGIAAKSSTSAPGGSAACSGKASYSQVIHIANLVFTITPQSNILVTAGTGLQGHIVMKALIISNISRKRAND
jgi:hypothetical protein